MKRWLLASAIFIGGMLVILAVPAYRSYRAISTEKATGIALVISRDTILFNLVLAILLGAFAVWLSGRLVR